jgi:hypothetical protein
MIQQRCSPCCIFNYQYFFYSETKDFFIVETQQFANCRLNLLFTWYHSAAPRPGSHEHHDLQVGVCA